MKTRFLCLALAIVAIIPAAVAQWVHSAGPEGGFIQAIVAYGPDLFAGTYGSGIFWSSDKGDHWVPSCSGLTHPDIYSFAVCDDILFAGAGTDVFSSTDAGRTWNGTGLRRTNVWSLITKGKKLFAATGLGVFRSTDHGVSWNSVVTEQVWAVAADETRLVVGTNANGVYLSTDDGLTWNPAGLAGLEVRTVAIIGGNIYAGTWAWPNKQTGGGFRSTDNGTTWTEVIPPDEFFGVSCFAEQDSTIYAGTWGYVQRSTDGGVNWSDSKTGFAGMDVRSLAVGFGNVYAGTSSRGGGMYRSTNGGSSWMQVNTGLSGVEVEALMARGTTLLAGSWYATHRSTNQGASWVKVNSIPSTCFASLGSSLYAGGWGVYRSTNDGATWMYTGALPSDRVSSMTTKGSTLLCGIQYQGIFRSTDEGAHWYVANAGLTDTMFVISMATCGPYIFAGGSRGISRSSDDGLSWYDPRDTGSTCLPQIAVYALAVSGTKIFAGTWGAGVFLSTDYGRNWVPVSSALPDNIVLSLAVVNGNLFAGTHNEGVFLTTDEGTTWSDVNAGFLKSRVHALASDGWNAYMCGVSNIWVRPLSQMISTTAVSKQQDLPRQLSVSQNYPNPFNPSTTISYALPQRSHVVLTIYNALGQKVAELVNAEKEPGSYDVTFDASGLSSGVYLYRIQAGSFVQTKKLVLMK